MATPPRRFRLAEIPRRSLAFVLASLAVALFPVLALRRRLRSRSRPIASLWSGEPILTLPVNARAERMLGIDARTLVFETYFITGEFDYNLQGRLGSPLRRYVVQTLVFLWACWTFDRLHFFCDRGLLPQLSPREFNPFELRFYRALRMEVFFWTYGADVRTQTATRALGEPNCCTECPEPGKFCICDPSRGEANQESIRRTATRIFSMGDMIEYTPGSRNDLFFWPLDLGKDEGRRYAPRFPDPNGGESVRIVHAANHRQFKGTHFLVEAVEKLKSEGVAVELVLVEKIPNEQALEIYRSADIVFDQCLIGFHGYFALEAMAMGKPVMTFIRKREYLLAPDECPLVSASAREVETTLRSLVRDRARLNELGRRGRRYVEAHYGIEAFSRRLGAATARPS